MKKIKVYVKKFTTKDGREFYKATCKGQYLPLLEADEEEFYNIVDINKRIPQREGAYLVGYNDNDLWLDTREEMISKNIVRVRSAKVVKA